ncbi:MAG: DoxX family protein [Spirosomataceae bacterium]
MLKQGQRNSTIWAIYLLLTRLWLGYSMIMGGQSILRFFSSQELRDFFQNWFGNELGFPAPLLMAFLAKGTEFIGGILLCLGGFTRIAASFIAFVMLIATLTANLDYTGTQGFIRQDGVVTISCFLFAGLFILSGGGRYSLDRFIFSNPSSKYRFLA